MPHGEALPFGLYDGQSRVVRYLRLSVTDRCSFRCVYCMPEEGLEFVPRPEVMTFEELHRLVGVFARLGVTHVRLTGGEPLLRRDLPELARLLAGVPGVQDIALSTNGLALAEMARPLAEAGLKRVNVSVDSLDGATFSRLTRTREGTLERVLAGLEAAKAAGLWPIKLNAVVIRGENEAELPRLVRFAAARGYVLRLIEYMPIGVDDRWGPTSFVSVDEMRQRLADDFVIEPYARPADLRVQGGGPARYARLRAGDETVEVGFITAVSDHFCATCNRVRVTATGKLQECLAFPGHVSLRDLMRAGASDDELAATLASALGQKGPGHRFQIGQRTYQSMSITGG
jgi:cyclic pyranopterin phosphate synthase